MVPEHEVGEDAGGAARHPHLAVDEDLAAGAERQVYEVHHVVEVDGDVGLGHVHQLDTLVGDTPGLVILLPNIKSKHKTLDRYMKLWIEDHKCV